MPSGLEERRKVALNIALIGYGEAGSTFARAGDWAGSVWDL
jgi:hypothetical protein